MIKPFSGKKIRLDLAEEILFYYTQLKRLKFVFDPDRRDLFEVTFEYSFDDWKTILSEPMDFCNISYSFQIWIDFATHKNILYRFKISDMKNSKPRYIDNDSSNFMIKLPTIRFFPVEDFKTEISRELSEGKIISTGFTASSITPWSLGHRAILSDIRNERLKNFMALHGGKENLDFLAVIMADRISEYLTPPALSEFGEKKAYLDRSAHPYILPFMENPHPEVRYFSLRRSEDSPLAGIISNFEALTRHPILWITNSGDSQRDFSKPDTESDVFFNFLNSYTDFLYFEHIKVERTET